YIEISLPDVPNLGRKRTLFNRSALISANSLIKLKRGEFKSQIDYSFSRVTAHAQNITTYFLGDGNRIVNEDRNGIDRSHSLSGKFIYEQNRKTAFINNILKTNIGWDNVRLRVDGSSSNDQVASLPDYYVSNDFKLIKRFKGKHLITFKSMNEWESLPQTLSVTMADGLISQHVGDHAFYTSENAAYAFAIKGVTISLEVGVNGYLRSLNSTLSQMPEEVPGTTINVLNTNYTTVYATPKVEYGVGRVDLSLDAEVRFSHYTFDQAIADRSEVYFSPSLRMNWKPNNRFSMGISGGTGRSPMTMSLIQPGYIMTDYRSFRRGVDDFYNSSSQNVSVNMAYKNTRRGLFADGVVMQSWSHNPYTLTHRLYGDYEIYSYTSARSDGQMLMASGNIGKTLDFIHGSARLNGSFSRHESNFISESNSVHSVGTSWSAGVKINATPIRWLSFDYRFAFSSRNLSMGGVKASWLGNIENEIMLNVVPHKKWEWRISGEHYRNEITNDNYKNVFLLDTKVVFKLNKRLEFSTSLSNLLNYRTYKYVTYNQLSSFESRRWLRGRELLISFSLRR
ncbi:MAG: hypothetical protein K2H87_00980, partial [Duncaniella sp.]|nr:hypothetical protein [Duncaniella sp.]